MEITKEAFQNGQVILIDKPLEWTSFQVVNKVRWLIRKHLNIKKIKVGHAGTLDPLASGLLILCCGKMTKSIEKFQGQEKEYSGEMLLGATTASYDLETEINRKYPIQHITLDEIENARQKFIGKILQQPPLFSALKKEGKRLYEFARQGETVEIPKREINIRSFSLNSHDFPRLKFKVSCSKGTYIRSLAHDFGQALNSGAHLTALRRERIGEFTIQEALSIDQFEDVLRAKSNKRA